MVLIFEVTQKGTVERYNLTDSCRRYSVYVLVDFTSFDFLKVNVHVKIFLC